MNWEFFIGPLVGAIIGYITNGIAIKMLFRPLKPIIIGGYTLPFTPGVIPKEKERIARSIGRVVSRELLNEEVLKKALLKPEVYKVLEEKVDHYIDTNQTNETKLKLLGNSLLGEEQAALLVCETEKTVTSLIYTKVVNMELGKLIVEKLLTTLKGGALGYLLGPMSFLIKDQMLESLGDKIEPAISEMIVKEAEEIIGQAIEEESGRLQETTVGEWVSRLNPYREEIKKLVVESYKKLVNQELSHALEKLNIAYIVEERIMDFDTLELENLILEIMSKELNRVIWLGALLGGIMGCITSFF